MVTSHSRRQAGRVHSAIAVELPPPLSSTVSHPSLPQVSTPLSSLARGPGSRHNHCGVTSLGSLLCRAVKGFLALGISSLTAQQAVRQRCAASAQTKVIDRKLYNVSAPICMWHIDSWCKLASWNLWVHAIINGYSHYAVAAVLCTNMQGDTVYDIYTSAKLPGLTHFDIGTNGIEPCGECLLSKASA
ncbi:hypothetical protein SELMODRAFT_431746 [Selaginella moellendorffii]|uniref:Integrase core domain-containing protein n=1 Tax=Selaginella moellendorffii TaxID=88036 RepID=D8TDN0_SELML|nr:hypothetical protein SELMODRAFT_431746 [Selaginella moellendorffii]